MPVGLMYHTPPEMQGQGVVVSYSSTGDFVFMKEVSPAGKTSYWCAPWDAVVGAWEPWNAAPAVDDDEWVRVVLS